MVRVMLARSALGKKCPAGTKSDTTVTSPPVAAGGAGGAAESEKLYLNDPDSNREEICWMNECCPTLR
ncbi:hypothetical protein EMCRGX_G012393 [Ephydatia muelleri]